MQITSAESIMDRINNVFVFEIQVNSTEESKVKFQNTFHAFRDKTCNLLHRQRFE